MVLSMFICSGYAPGNILKVLKGDRIGTLFHQDAHLWTPQKDVGARDMAVAARESSRRLQVIAHFFVWNVSMIFYTQFTFHRQSLLKRGEKFCWI